MFSDILTPLPAMGIDFDVIKGKGPVISNPPRSSADVAKLTHLEDPSVQLPFVGETLRNLRKETEGRTSLLGFVGAPFTLAAYSVNGAADKHCFETKKVGVGGGGGWGVGWGVGGVLVVFFLSQEPPPPNPSPLLPSR